MPGDDLLDDHEMEYKVLNKKHTKLHNKFSFQDSKFD